MMLFCKDVLTPSYTTGNLPDTDLDISNDSCSSENTEIEVEANLDATAEYFSSTTTKEKINLSNNQNDNENVKQKKNKIRKSDEANIDSFLALEQKKIKILENAQNTENTFANDSDYHFLISLLPYFKELDSLQKLELRQNIQTVVLNAHRQKLVSRQVSNVYNHEGRLNRNPNYQYVSSMQNTSYERSTSDSTTRYHSPSLNQKDLCNTLNIQTFLPSTISPETQHDITPAGEFQTINYIP